MILAARRAGGPPWLPMNCFWNRLTANLMIDRCIQMRLEKLIPGVCLVVTPVFHQARIAEVFPHLTSNSRVPFDPSGSRDFTYS